VTERAPVDWPAVKRVLVIMLRYHGDVLLTSPIFSVLKAQYPGLEIDALVYADTAPMLRNHPAIHTVYCIDRRWREEGTLAQLRGMAGLTRQLLARRYDLTIHLTTHWLGAWLNRLLRPRYALVPDFQKAKRSGRLWRGGFTHFYPYRAGAHKHMVEKHLDGLRYAGLQPVPENSRLLLRPPAKAVERAEALLAEHGLLDAPYVVVHPTSRAFYKCWPEDRVAQVIDHLSAAGWPVVVTSAPDVAELQMVQRIADLCQGTKPVMLAGKLKLDELAALIDRASLLFGVDSVPMHIAAAVQTPSVALFGPSDQAEWGPWQATSRVISSRDFPRPPGESITDPQYRHSLVNIPLAPVLGAIDDVLAGAERA